MILSSNKWDQICYLVWKFTVCGFKLSGGYFSQQQTPSQKVITAFYWHLYIRPSGDDICWEEFINVTIYSDPGYQPLWVGIISILPIHYKLCKNLWLPGDMSLGKCTFEEVVILVSSQFQTNITFIFLCWPEDSISPCKGGFKVKKIQKFRMQVIIPFYNYLCCWERTYSFILAAYLLSCSSSSLFL